MHTKHALSQANQSQVCLHARVHIRKILQTSACSACPHHLDPCVTVKSCREKGEHPLKSNSARFVLLPGGLTDGALRQRPGAHTGTCARPCFHHFRGLCFISLVITLISKYVFNLNNNDLSFEDLASAGRLIYISAGKVTKLS